MNPQGVELDESTRKRLVALRHKKGLTQEQLARKCKVDRVTIANVEVGRKIPSHDLLSRWADALGRKSKVSTKVTLSAK